MNLCHTTPNLVSSQELSSRKQTYVRKFNPAIYTKHKRLWRKKCFIRPSRQSYNNPSPSPNIWKSYKPPMVPKLVWAFWRGEKSLVPVGTETPACAACRLVTKPTMQSCFPCAVERQLSGTNWDQR